MSTMLPVLPRAEFKHNSPFISSRPLTLVAFTSGLEEVLIQAKETGGNQEQTAALEQVVRECCRTDFDIGQAPIFAIQEIFMRLREKSIGETQELRYLCKNQVEEKDCNGEVKFSLDYKEFKVVTPEGHTQKFQLPGEYHIKFRYPCLNDYHEGRLDKGATANEILATLFDVLSHGDEVWESKDFTYEQRLAFIKGIGTKEKAEIVTGFIDKMPHLNFGVSQKCPKCGMSHALSFNGVKDVFL